MAALILSVGNADECQGLASCFSHEGTDTPLDLLAANVSYLLTKSESSGKFFGFRMVLIITLSLFDPDMEDGVFFPQLQGVVERTVRQHFRDANFCKAQITRDDTVECVSIVIRLEEMKETEVSETTMEKVKLVQDMIESFSTGVTPSEDQLKRAVELGIDIDGLRNAYESPTDY